MQRIVFFVLMTGLGISVLLGQQASQTQASQTQASQTQASQTQKSPLRYYSLAEFAKLYDWALVLYSEEEFAELIQGDAKLRVYLTVPYIRTPDRVYFLEHLPRLGEKGELLVPEEALHVLRQLTQDLPKPGNLDDWHPVKTPSKPPASKPQPTNTNQAADRIPDLGFRPINAVIIDPGHGGKDPGGIGYKGLKEKQVVLSVSRKVRDQLKQKIKVFMTRSGDYFVTLEGRTQKAADIAQNYNPIFISIHGNIALTRSARGAETYTLSENAVDSDALSTARIENSGFSEEDIERTRGIHGILGDLLRDSLRQESELLAKNVHSDMIKRAKFRNKGLKSANFYVLKYNSVPAILVEIGFLSNPSDAKRLRSSAVQDRIADGIAEGATQFIREYNQTQGFTK